MNILKILIIINYILCVLAVFDMIFINKKKPERIIAWTIFLFVPFVGLFVYLLIGAGLSIFVKNMIKKFKIYSGEYKAHINKQITSIETDKTKNKYPKEFVDLIHLNLKTCNSLYNKYNQIEYFVDGESAVDRLKHDIQKAKSSIHLQFYIFANDKIGKEMIKLLEEKAKQGVEVRVLYDAIGSIKTTKFDFRKLKKAGGMVSSFFPPFLNIKLLNLKANYRNHRKIAVIDGKIAYTGGLNIRDDHLGRVKRLAPWRDTTMRIVGESVESIQNIFLSDWRFATKDSSNIEKYLDKKYFPKFNNKTEQNVLPLQVLASGPDNLGESIKECMIKMIHQAKKTIKIQSPYFIPDEHFMGALKLALLSGIEVVVMFPKKFDHWYVHFASYSYINELLKFGLKVLVYDGFLHSKVLIVDDKIMTIGSCNIDIRSFALNFEDNVIIYSSEQTKKYLEYFDEDEKHCEIYDETKRKKKNVFTKIIISFCRLFSALM